jgi:predicted nucleotidyltransferase
MTSFPQPDGPRLLGQVTLPPITGALDTLWSLILDLAERVPRTRWQLIGGQMVMLHGLVAGRAPLRVSRDVDLLADLLTDRDGLRMCVRAVQDLRFEPSEDTNGRHVYRFVRAEGNAVVDVLAPDHFPPRWSLRTVRGKDTIQVEGGHQALKRGAVVAVIKDDRSAHVPVPDLLGALVMKVAAWVIDSRDKQRHSGDAAFLVSLIVDPVRERGRFAGSDSRRLAKLDEVLGDPGASEWVALGEYADDAYTAWRILVSQQAQQ